MLKNKALWDTYFRTLAILFFGITWIFGMYIDNPLLSILLASVGFIFLVLGHIYQWRYLQIQKLAEHGEEILRRRYRGEYLSLLIELEDASLSEKVDLRKEHENIRRYYWLLYFSEERLVEIEKDANRLFKEIREELDLEEEG